MSETAKHSDDKRSSWYIPAVTLVFLALQNSGHSICIRYSRGILREKYITSGAVWMMELLKCSLCLAVISYQRGVQTSAYLKTLLRSSLPLAVPAGMYFMQNTLSFVSLQNLDSAVFNVLSQTKLLTAAVFSVILLNRTLSWRKWCALFLLVTGVAMIVTATDPNARKCHGTETVAVAVKPAPQGNFWLGVGCVIALCFSSGFAGVYFEKILKSASDISLWDRNFQLSFYSLFFGWIQLFIVDHELLMSKGFFYDYSWVTWLSICIGAIGGILVAVVVKYADNIIKGYATSTAIIFTSLFSYFFFDITLDVNFALGVFVVIISLFNYGEEDPKPTVIVKVEPEKPSNHVDRIEIMRQRA